MDVEAVGDVAEGEGLVALALDELGILKRGRIMKFHHGRHAGDPLGRRIAIEPATEAQVQVEERLIPQRADFAEALLGNLIAIGRHVELQEPFANQRSSGVQSPPT